MQKGKWTEPPGPKKATRGLCKAQGRDTPAKKSQVEGPGGVAAECCWKPAGPQKHKDTAGGQGLTVGWGWGWGSHGEVKVVLKVRKPSGRRQAEPRGLMPVLGRTPRRAGQQPLGGQEPTMAAQSRDEEEMEEGARQGCGSKVEPTWWAKR